ncbi:glycosyltransferase [candidate division KSB1 bacterium]|nr:glycosyltransferase family 2 protein [candidate division KSB1 bacterium]NIS26394.1 glycosyltransferase family 2 protein [candidate division KSB1 bacterium]NIU27080.1 glycosyltransferase family 2 protein [candidate division KSB1 bacterium]NIU92934.1 glycosyltransferase [candidate division KSB1 bacterium]NIV95447.1 glycosyltransferase [candidate division KSB1 bacterium]
MTIICPVRNEEDHISECIESLLDQTFDIKDMEILIVDGLSDDRTREVVQGFQSKYKNIKLLDNPHRIVPSALNIGIKASSGKFILRMDGHAKAAQDYVEKCIEALKRNGAECVGGPITTFNHSRTGQAISLAMSSPFGVGNSGFRTNNERECFVDSLAFPAYKREVFEKFGLFDEELVRCQDDEFNFRIRKDGGKVLLSPAIRSWYYARSSFKDVWRQYFGYGYWKVRLLQKHFRMMQARHFVPAIFVASLISSMTLTLLMRPAFWLFLLILSSYLVASLSAAILTWRCNRQVSFFRLLTSFYVLHFSYGTGFLWGLIRFAPRWFMKK